MWTLYTIQVNIQKHLQEKRMSKPKTDISEIIEGVITQSPPKAKQDIEQEIERDKVNYLIWQIGVAVKELQQAINELQQDKDVS